MMNHNELSAREKAESGNVSRLLELIVDEKDTGAQYRMLNLIPTAVRAAAENGRVTDSLEVLGAEGINLHYQMLAVDILASSGKEEWLAGALTTKDIPEGIGLRIVKALAEAGQISTLAKIAEGKHDVPDSVRKKAEERLAAAYLEAAPEKRAKLTKEELLSITAMLAKKLNPLAGDGVLTRGNGRMIPEMRKLGRTSLKR